MKESYVYYPYLRGKQYELLSLRDFLDICGCVSHIFPIIEPVKKSFSSVTNTVEKWSARDGKIAVIHNPEVGELVGERSIIEENLSSCKGKYIPAFIVHDGTAEIAERISSSKPCMLIIKDTNKSFSHEEVFKLCAENSVKYILLDPAFRFLKRKIKKQYENEDSKKLIALYDCFEEKGRNVDYQDVGEQRFSEEYWYFSDDHFDGISDYTVLSSRYSEGGRLPYAVALHLTYPKDGTMMINHFVSDDTETSENIQKKFHQAAKKALAFCEEQHINSQGIKILDEFYKKDVYPGLGILKKISILNHLEQVNRIMIEQEENPT